MTKIGFIGVGVMGTPMAHNLVGKGFDVTLYDEKPGRAAEVAQEFGCKAAQSLDGLRDCDFIVCMLPDGKVVQEVLTRAQQQALIKSLQAGHGLHRHELLGADADARDRRRAGQARLDAGRCAGFRRADARRNRHARHHDRLRSDEALLDKVSPVLSAMGNQLFVLGGLGNGHAMKAINNIIAGSAMIAVAEGLAVGEEFGLDPKTMVDVLNASTGRSFVTELVAKEHVITKKFATGFALGLIAKDVRIAADLGEDIELDAPLFRLVRERFATAREHAGRRRRQLTRLCCIRGCGQANPKRRA